jgi:hypothetical protein
MSEVVGLVTALDLDCYTAILQNGTNDGTPESHARNATGSERKHKKQEKNGC